MPSSTLTPDNYPAGRDRSVLKGHGTAALGPSDSSDSGSDLMGAPGLARQVDGFGLDHTAETDLEEGFAGGTAGPDIGDANLDSDSDRYGTGEVGASGRDNVAEDGADIGTDRIEYLPPDLDEPEPPVSRR
jgi:hypothetical protein